MLELREAVLEAAGAVENPVGDIVNVLGNRIAQRAEMPQRKPAKAREVAAKRAAEARMKGYEGDACGRCGNFTLVRNGTCMKCNTCGWHQRLLLRNLENGHCVESACPFSILGPDSGSLRRRAASTSRHVPGNRQNLHL